MPSLSLRRAAVALLALPLLLTGCAGSPDATPDTSSTANGEPTTIRMGIQPWIGYSQWYVADENGFTDANDIKVELTELKTDADQSAAFASGRIDMDNIASHTALMLISQGVPLKIVMIEDSATTADALLARGDIKTPADLKGKRVAYEQGATSDLLLHAALESAGLTLDDIVPVPMPAADAGAALIGKKVDAAVTYEPYVNAALAGDDQVHRVFDAEQSPGLISDVLVVSEKFAAENPDAVRRAIKTWGEAVNAYNADLSSGRAVIANAVGEEPDALTSAFDGVKYYGAAENAAEFTTTFTNETLPRVLEAARKAGIITEDVDLSKVTDPQYLS